MSRRASARARLRHEPRRLPIWRMALRDLVHDWRLSSVGVLAITVVLAPLILLVGLKEGVVETLRERLASDPANLELRHYGENGFDATWFETMAAQPGVAFLVPRTRHTHTSLLILNLENRDAPPVEVDLIPSGPGDPLLGYYDVRPPGRDGLVLSQRAAEALLVQPGAVVTGQAVRFLSDGRREAVRFDLTVEGVLPLTAGQRARAYVPFEILEAVEDYREWQRVERFGWSGDTPLEDDYASFRLYAQTIDAVEPLRRYLVDQHLDIESAADRIAVVQRIDRDLGLLFSVLLGLAVIGYVASLSLTLLANVARKRTVLAVLRMIGFRARDIMLFPVTQGALLALAGTALALVVFLTVQPLLDVLFADAIESEGSLTRLTRDHVLASFAGSIALSVLASSAASWSASQIHPSETLRHEAC